MRASVEPRAAGGAFRWALWPLFFTMMVAAFKAHAGKFSLQDGGMEYALTLGVVVLGSALTGLGGLAFERYLPFTKADLSSLFAAARWSPSAFNEQPWRYLVARREDEATSRGLVVHQMAGILPARVLELYGVPEGFQSLTARAIGYAADPQTLPDAVRQRDTAPRQRRPQREFVFAGAWGQAAELG